MSMLLHCMHAIASLSLTFKNRDNVFKELLSVFVIAVLIRVTGVKATVFLCVLMLPLALTVNEQCCY